MGKSRFNLEGTYPSRKVSRLNPITGALEFGYGMKKSERNHNRQVLKVAFNKLLQITEGWVYSHTDGDLKDVASISEMHFREGCELFDGRIFYEGWQ